MRFDEARFLPGGDHFILVQLGDDGSIDLNFLALGLTAALKADQTRGVVDTNPSYNSLVVEYDSDDISYGDLQVELERLIGGLGSVEELELDSRLAYLPVMYLDPWTRECVTDYSEKITPREYDPDFVARENGFEDAKQLARVHSGTEHWVVAVCSTPGLPLLRALDPRCAITSPKYNPPRTWTTLGAIGVGGLSTSIYTTPGPGGYNLIGRTPVPLWDPQQRHPIFKDRVVLLDAADRVKFVPIDAEEFDYIEARVADGSYEFNITAYQRFSVGAYKKWVASLNVDGRF
ncbi:MAG TPA: carboxyltransferase domain-containing protein [Alphaproteobacteria bacterium]|nr:carboxyltransferase domain-containing protein [Alphaproteobacteria bacterium]